MNEGIAMSNSNMQEFRERSRLFVVNVRSVGIERVRTGETHRTESKSTYSTQTCVNPKRLSFVNAIRQEDIRSSRLYGVRLPDLGNFVVCPSVEAAEKYANDLRTRQSRFNDAVKELVREWNDLIEAHCVKHPEDAREIRAFAPSTAEVTERTKFSWKMFPLAAMKALDGSGDFDAELTGSLAERAFAEFKAQLGDSFDGYGKTGWRPDKFSQAARQHLLSIAHKAKALGAFHPSLAALPGVIDEVLQGCPLSGNITGASALAIRGLMDILALPEQAMKFGFVTKPAAPEPQKAPRSRKTDADPVVVVPQKTPVSVAAMSDW
jgi:hypothetical protein